MGSELSITYPTAVESDHQFITCRGFCPPFLRAVSVRRF